MPWLSLLPIFAWFAAGVVLRRSGLAGGGEGAFLFRLIFFVTLPALAFNTIVDMHISGILVLLPVSAFVVNAVCMAAAIAYLRNKALPPRNAGAVVIGAGITNTGFMFPFAQSILGEQGLAYAILFDTGNAIFVSTVGYFVALSYGNATSTSMTASLVKTLRAPMFVAIAAAIVLNLAGVKVPDVVFRILTPLGNMTLPLILLALGVSFSLATLRGVLPAATVALRMVLGFAAGLAIVFVFRPDPMFAAILVASAAAPIGFSSVTLASVANMDAEQATGALSLSIAIGLFTTPLLLWALSDWFGSAAL